MVWQCIAMENEDNRAFQLENKYITYSFSDGCIWSASTEFQSNVLQSFKSLRQRPDFSDVTLVSGDGPQRIEALKTTDHKKRFSNTMNAVDDVKDKSQIWRKNKLLEQKLLAPKEKGWSCNTCGKLLGKKFKMKNHVEIHNRNFIHVCTFCLERAMVFNFTFIPRIETTLLLPLNWRRKCIRQKSNDLYDLSSLESIT